MNRFSPEFLESRRKGLDIFLKRVLNHPVLSKSEDVKVFVSGTDQQFQTAKARGIPSAHVKKEPEEKKGFLASLTSTLSNVGSNLSSVTSVEAQEIDPWFESYKTYINSLEQGLTVMQQRSNANSKKKQEFVQTLSELSHASSQLSACEVGQDDLLSEVWSKLSEVASQMSTVHGELAQSEIDGYEETVKDYILQVHSVKDVLENRNISLQKLQNLEYDVKVKQERLAKNTSASKAPQLQAEVKQAESVATDQQKAFDTLSKEVRTELEAFKQKKGKVIHKAITDLVRQNMDAQLRIVGLWKEMLADLEDKKKN